MVVQELIATLGVEVDEQLFNRADLALKGLVKGALGIGAAVGAAVVGIGALVHGTAEAARGAANVAAIGGTTAERVQEIAYAAAETNTELHDLSDIFLDLSERALDASSGTGEYADVFRQAGVSVHDSSGKLKSAERLLMDLSDAFAGMTDKTKRAALASKLIGEQGSRQLLPVMVRGSAAFKAAAQEAREYGLILSEDTVKAAKEFTDESRRMGASLTGVRNEISSELMPEFTALLRVVGQFIRENRKLVTTPVVGFFRLLSGAVRLVAENMGIVKGLLVITTGFLVASYLPTLAAVTAGQVAWGAAALIAGARAAAGAAMATAALWLPLVPIALLAAGIIFLYDELYTFVTGGETLLGRLINWFETADPTDSLFVRQIKAVGALLFDLTNPERWLNLGGVILADVLGRINAIKEGIKGFFSWLGSIEVSGFEVPDSGQPRTSQTRPVGAMFGAGSAGPSAAAAGSYGSSTSNTFAPNMTATVQVTAPQGGSPRDYGDAVGNALSDTWNGELAAAYAATGPVR